MFASAAGSEQRDGVVRVVPETDRIVAVCLEGEFDLANARDLRDEIDRALEGGNDLILDLSQATFVDSSIISVLVQGSREARARQQNVVLQLGTAAIVERVLELFAIEQVLPRAQDRKEAVRVIRQQPGVV
jgi:anti-anti-sigma factor